MGRRRAAFALVLGAGLALTRPAAAGTALDLVEIARGYEAAHQEEIALRRYMDALDLDPTCSEAYLGLGSLRARRGDLREAERVYNVALEHLPGLREARLARGHVRRALGANEGAVDDVMASSGNELLALRTIATWHGEDGRTPAQLAVWRQILVRAEALQLAAVAKEARTMVRALVIIVGPADPAAAPTDERAFRRMLAQLARRGG